jgi:ornithine--oxo-acid transaminase
MDAIRLEARYAAANYHPLPVVLTRGEGVWLWDQDGSRYLDMMSAYSAVSHGHAHPRIIAALEAQARRLAVPSRAFHSDRLGPFLEKLCTLAGLDAALPMNTGAEAVETAIKAARRWGYRVKGIAPDRAEIIVADGNFHGRTTTIVGFSSEDSYRDGFGPFTPGFRAVPFGDLEAAERAITPNTAAILVEPIQGEAGIIVPPAGWLAGLRRLCDAHRVLLILDEVQSGLGRTGAWFAFEHEHVRPDGLIVGKALGGGVLPVSAFLGTRELMDVFTPGSHGSTFGGNPLAAAVGLEALAVIEEEGLVENSRVLGAHLLARLGALRSPVLRAVRGRGLWVGAEIDPAVASAREVCERLLAKGVLSKETHDTVVRLAPPLVITKADLDWGIDRFADVLRDLQRRRQAAA